MLAVDEDADEQVGNGADGALKLPDLINHQMDEPLKLRACFIPLMVIHSTFIATNIWFYSLEIMLFAVDFSLLVLDMIYYRTVSKVTVAIEMVIKALVCVVAISHFQRVFLSDDKVSGGVILNYLLQFFVIYPIALVVVGIRFKKLVVLHERLKDEEKAKTFKGRLILKAKQKALSREKGKDFIK